MMDRRTRTEKKAKEIKQIQQTNREIQVDVHSHPNTNTTGSSVFFVFTFLQALMDEATVLSVLPPSTSTHSEPSNMAEDWKLLQDKSVKE